jgi:hypothetical protein
LHVNGVIGTVMIDSTAEVTEVLTEEVAAAIVTEAVFSVTTVLLAALEAVEATIVEEATMSVVVEILRAEKLNIVSLWRTSAPGHLGR